MQTKGEPTASTAIAVVPLVSADGTIRRTTTPTVPVGSRPLTSRVATTQVNPEEVITLVTLEEAKTAAALATPTPEITNARSLRIA